MITNKNFRHILVAGTVCCASCAALTACSDWDDHYDADTSILASQTTDLWQNINNHGQLKEFAALMKKTGYDKLLVPSQTFTVWAPLDNTYDYAALEAETDDRVRKEFVMNHIARNNYNVSGTVNEKIFMLNQKMMVFDGSEIQGIKIDSLNIASKNGTLHTLKSKIPFLQNIYESLNNEVYAIDSISKFFHDEDDRRFDDANSVPGPVVDGEQTYLDSVYTEYNKLFYVFNAHINREDSNYSMLIPTNEAWTKTKNEILPLLNYSDKIRYREDTNDKTKDTTIVLRDAAGLRDSMANLLLVRHLTFNNNIGCNKPLQTLQTGSPLVCDSLEDTYFGRIYSEDAARLFAGAQRVDKSNGCIWVTESLGFRPWNTWNRPRTVQTTFASNISGYQNTDGEPTVRRVSASNRNPEVKGSISQYLEVRPSASNTNPQVDFFLPDVMSTTYSIYAVVVPANITNAKNDTLPNNMIVTLGYTDDKAMLQETRMMNPTTGKGFHNNIPSKIDTLFLGDFTFPVAYYGTGCKPFIQFRTSVTNSNADKYDRTLRIAKIILLPKELDTYIKENPDYLYY